MDTVNHKAILNSLTVLLKSNKGNVHMGICAVLSLKTLLLGFAFVCNDKECFKVHNIFFTFEFQMFSRCPRDSEMPCYSS